MRQKESYFPSTIYRQHVYPLLVVYHTFVSIIHANQMFAVLSKSIVACELREEQQPSKYQLWKTGELTARTVLSVTLSIKAEEYSTVSLRHIMSLSANQRHVIYWNP
jgi:hypothetical protein